ncbi:hypothetical protein MMC19_000606 [Ptychographa xylographoides]|nr:hypothetical protein [Ptychographa xylographoides]
MASYLNSLTSHYTSLKRLIPTSQSEDSDLNVTSESDSHVSRVLRAYYTEKGRPFPAWLGPDPNVQARPTIAALSSAPNPVGAGSLRSGRGAPAGGGGGGLGDLFANGALKGNNSEPESLSLRQRRPGIRSPGVQSGSSDSIPYPPKAAQSSARHAHSTSSSSIGNAPTSEQPNVRLLPSQRAGSYQTRLGTAAASSTPSLLSTSSSGSNVKESSVQERLKARLGGSGSRGASPVFGNSSATSSATSNTRSGGDYDPYSTANYNAGVGGGFNPYEDIGMGSGRETPFASNSDSSKGNSSRAPYVAASSPWVSDDNYGDMGGGGHFGGNYGGGNAPNVMPSGRRGAGLPSSDRRRG